MWCPCPADTDAAGHRHCGPRLQRPALTDTDTRKPRDAGLHADTSAYADANADACADAGADRPTERAAGQRGPGSPRSLALRSLLQALPGATIRSCESISTRMSVRASGRGRWGPTRG